MRPAGHRLVLLALTIGSFGIGTSEFSSMGLLQLFAADLGIDIPQATHAITAYALGVVVGAPLVTLAAARVNRRPLLIGLMGLFILGNLLSATASGFGMLVVGRFVNGLPQGAYFGAGAMVAAHVMGPGKGGRAFAIIIFGLTVATIIGAPLGTAVGQHFGWRVAYGVYAAYGVLAFAAMLLWLPKSRELDGGPILQELSALRKWRVWAMMVIASIAVASVFAVYTFIGPLVTEVAGLSAGRVPFAQAIYGIGLALGSILGGRLADRHTYKGLVIGFAGTLAGLAVMALFGGEAVVLMATLFAVGFTMQVAIPTVPVRMIHMAPEAPTLMGAMNMAAFNVANAIGAAVGGVTVAAGMGYLSAVWAGFALTALGLILFALVRTRLKPAEDTPATSSVALARD